MSNIKFVSFPVQIKTFQVPLEFQMTIFNNRWSFLNLKTKSIQKVIRVDIFQFLLEAI